MSITPESPSKYEAPFFPFPQNPNFVRKKNMLAHEYIPPNVFLRQLQEVCRMIDFSKFAAVVYNLKGGEFPAKIVAEIKRYREQMIPVEYHMSKDGKPVDVVKRIPKYLEDERVLVIEDVYDTGGVYQRMRQDCKDLHMLVMSYKLGVKNQIPPSENVIPVFRTVNKWQAGMGMNIDYGEKDPFYQLDAFREYAGILVRPSDELLDKYSQGLLTLTV